MTKMIIGYRCAEDVELSAKDVGVAEGRLRNDFAFIGLTEVRALKYLQLGGMGTNGRGTCVWCSVAHDVGIFLLGMGQINMFVSPDAWGACSRN